MNWPRLMMEKRHFGALGETANLTPDSFDGVMAETLVAAGARLKFPIRLSALPNSGHSSFCVSLLDWTQHMQLLKELQIPSPSCASMSNNIHSRF